MDGTGGGSCSSGGGSNGCDTLKKKLLARSF